MSMTAAHSTPPGAHPHEAIATGETYAPDAAFEQRRKARNRAIGWCLAGFVLLFFVTTVVKLAVSVGSL